LAGLLKGSSEVLDMIFMYLRIKNI